MEVLLYKKLSNYVELEIMQEAIGMFIALSETRDIPVYHDDLVIKIHNNSDGHETIEIAGLWTVESSDYEEDVDFTLLQITIEMVVDLEAGIYNWEIGENITGGNYEVSDFLEEVSEEPSVH